MARQALMCFWHYSCGVIINAYPCSAFFVFFLSVEPEKYVSGLEIVFWCAMTYQGEATNAQLCLRLIKIPHVHPSAIYLTANIISLLASPCVFRSNTPLSIFYQSNMIFLEILFIKQQPGNQTSVPFKVRQELCDSHHGNDIQLVLRMRTYL